MLNKLKSIIRLALVTNTSSDDKQFPVQQVTERGKFSDVMVMLPYGIHANMSVDALVALLAVNADESSAIAIGGYTADRPQMAEGENCIFHPPTGTKIHFKANGTIEINTGGSDTTMNLTGNLNVSGNIVADGEVTAGDVTLTGHVHAGTSLVTTATVGASTTPGIISGDTTTGTG